MKYGKQRANSTDSSDADEAEQELIKHQFVQTFKP